MDEQNRNLLLATALSFLVIIVWFALFPPEEPTQATDATTVAEQTADADLPSASDNQGTTISEPDPAAEEAGRIAIATPEFSGSISLLGGRIDDLSLLGYKETLDDNAPTVTLLKPEGEAGAYFAAFGWVGLVGIENVPTPNTIWSIESGSELTPDSPVSLVWDNGSGQIFRRTIAVDDAFMFTVTQSVENAGNEISVRPYGLLRRHGLPDDLKNFFILHEGLVRMSDAELQETNYDDVVDFAENEGRVEVAERGWVGWTDHYWMTTLIPDQSTGFRSDARYIENRDVYQAEAVLPEMVIGSGETVEVTTQVFAGAKEWAEIRDYQTEGVEGFLDSIDWGWFFFLTKPMFWLLHTLNTWIGNMGWSIIALTVVIKILVLPLAYKSNVSMARMKELQPEMEALKERSGDDRQALQQGMMKLYKDNKVNPASGCMPILIQIPIFFSLYKVIFVTIALRHEPWFGWLKDLSAPDPSSIFNFFGLLPWGAPVAGSIFALLFIGILPILLGVSMWLQQKLNPAPTDPTQKMIFAWMPWVFMFMLGSFASGLVIYWIANNVITFIQQYTIMRSIGAKPDLFGNIKQSFKRAAQTETADTAKSKDK